LKDQEEKAQKEQDPKPQHTIHVSRLKLLFIAAKIVSGNNTVKIHYSSHLSGRERLDHLIHNLDILRNHPKILNSPVYWHKECQLPMQTISCMKIVG